jgi:hypothetical protein
MSDHSYDPIGELEPAEREALTALITPPALSDAEWQHLHRSVMLATHEALARRRTLAPVRSPARPRIRRWLLPVLPLAAAATLLLFILPNREQRPPLGVTEEVLLGDMSDHEFRLLVSGHADAASLLLLAVDDQHE